MTDPAVPAAADEQRARPLGTGFHLVLAAVIAIPGVLALAAGDDTGNRVIGWLCLTASALLVNVALVIYGAGIALARFEWDRAHRPSTDDRR